MKEIIFPINLANQKPMTAYMKDKFPFAGIKAPERKILTKAFIKGSQKLSEEKLLELIKFYYGKSEREYQYLAIDLATANVKRLSYATIIALVPYISEKAWWDSVDAWRKVFGLRIKYFPQEKNALFALFYQSQDFWQRRVGINLQLMEKAQTDLTLLTKAILKDRLTAEFFIQKAIGWSLRQYSKTDPHWVSSFLATHELSSLAIREASKHLKSK